MGKEKLFTAIIGGAVLGGLLSLFNKDVRTYTNVKLIETKLMANYYFKNPSEAIGRTRLTIIKFNKAFESQSKNALNAFEQIEGTLDKVIKKDTNEQELLK